MAAAEDLWEVFRKPALGEMVLETFVLLVPVWICFLIGVVIGWAWKPRWAVLGNYKFNCSSPPSSALIPSPVKRNFGSAQSFDSFRVRTQSFDSCFLDPGVVDKEPYSFPLIEKPNSSMSNLKEEDTLAVTDEDLRHLCHLVERKDRGPPWKHMMDHSTPTMTYQAWQRDPETGPPQYCSRTVFENATPELLRDFFWDDEFRLKWDDMLIHAETVEECSTTGTMVVHWIRKFPFFCSNREYTIIRRIWESGRTYYCVTKGVPCPSIPRRQKPRRVDVYYSSWFIQSVGSRKGNGQPPACEVIFFHHEDMGIPWEIAKFGVRQGMWGASKKVERGLHAYQKEKQSTKYISRPAFMARFSTKIDPNYLNVTESDEETSETIVVDTREKTRGMNVPKLLVFGGAVLLACTLDRGLLAKTLIFGVSRRFANVGKRACTPRT